MRNWLIWLKYPSEALQRDFDGQYWLQCEIFANEETYYRLNWLGDLDLLHPSITCLRSERTMHFPMEI
jgi:hypothetical protein